MNLIIKTITSYPEFIKYEIEWKDFEKKISNVNFTCSYDWLFTWWQTYKDVNNNILGYSKELLIICIYEGEELLAILPLLRLQRKLYGFRIRLIEFLSQQLGSCYLDIITKDLSVNHIEYIFTWLKNNIKYDIIFLKHIPEYSNNFDKDYLFEYSACPQIFLNKFNSFDDYVRKKYSKKLRQNIRTSYNRATKNNVKLTTTIENVDDINFSEIKRISSFKIIDNKINKYDDIHQEDFYRRICNKLDFNICFVKLDGINVAYRLNVVYNNNYYCVDASYDRNYKHYDLGALSVDISLRDCYDNKYVSHCMGPGLEEYKSKFAKEVIKLHIFIEQGNTMMGLPFKLTFIRILKRRTIQFGKMLKNYKEKSGM